MALDRVQFKLKKVKKFLKGWGYNKSGLASKMKKEITEEILHLELMEEKGNLTHTLIELRNSLKPS
jgi:hypothetical protein